LTEKKCTIHEPLASLGDRIIAYIIDFFVLQLGGLLGAILTLIIWGIVAAIDAGSTGMNDEVYVIVLSITGILAFLLWIGFNFYYLVFWLVKHQGQTIGKKKKKIRIMVVENLEDGKIRKMTKDDLGIILLRLVFSIVDALFFGLVGLYLINNDPNKQRFADQQAKTVVIQEK
jgi:hypothetical protein